MATFSETLKYTLEHFPKVHPKGKIFVYAFFAIAFVFLFFCQPMFWIMSILGLYTIFFFRAPERISPNNEKAIVSAADGTVTSIDKNQRPPTGNGSAENDDSKTYTRISVFLSLLDVHINYSPVHGKVIKTEHVKGKFRNIAHPDAAAENEKQVTQLKANNGDTLYVVQIAGLLARRIVNLMHNDQNLKMSQQIGLIRFGSRVDLYIPDDLAVNVSVGQTMVAGETVMAEFK